MAERVVDDPDVQSALEWFLEIAGNRRALEQRIQAAQAFYRAGSVPKGLYWPETQALVMKDDLIASYLAQADALLRDWRAYDLVLGTRIVPFIKHIGKGIDSLRQMPGAVERARRLLNPKREHPDGALYELVTAVRYARDDYEVEFVPETSDRAGDLRVGVLGTPKEVQIECKRLRPSVYELREAVLIRQLFDPLKELIHARRLSVHVDVRFNVELAKVPGAYLAERVATALDSGLALPNGYPWQDAYAEGVVRDAHLDQVLADTKNSSLLFSTKMARLLTGQTLPNERILMALCSVPREEDPRYVDDVAYASVLSWHCLAPASVEARGRHIKSLLADIDRQLANAPLGIAHIGMDAERDIATADRRRERNLQAVQTFQANSRLLEVHLHYYLPRVSEGAAWMIDESVDPHSRWNDFLLHDRRLLALGETDIENCLPVWHLPPPPVPPAS